MLTIFSTSSIPINLALLQTNYTSDYTAGAGPGGTGGGHFVVVLPLCLFFVFVCLLVRCRFRQAVRHAFRSVKACHLSTKCVRPLTASREARRHTLLFYGVATVKCYQGNVARVIRRSHLGTLCARLGVRGTIVSDNASTLDARRRLFKGASTARAITAPLNDVFGVYHEVKRLARARHGLSRLLRTSLRVNARHGRHVLTRQDEANGVFSNSSQLRRATARQDRRLVNQRAKGKGARKILVSNVRRVRRIDKGDD